MSKPRYKNISKARVFLKAVEEALEVAEDIHNTTNVWGPRTDTSYGSPPPLLRQSASWREAVDKETFRRFELLVDFMRDAIFGVDCDNDSAVRFAVVDMARQLNFLPIFHVPRVDWEAPLAKRWEQLETAKANAASARDKVDQMQSQIDRDLQKVIKKEDRLRKARGCEICNGNGWVESDRKTYEALDYGEQCRLGEVGCNWQRPPEGVKRRGPFRLFCGCQQEEED